MLGHKRGWFPLLTMIPSEGGQWGRYNLPRYIYGDDWGIDANGIVLNQKNRTGEVNPSRSSRPPGHLLISLLSHWLLDDFPIEKKNSLMRLSQIIHIYKVSLRICPAWWHQSKNAVTAWWLYEPWSILTIWLMVIPSIIRILIMVIINPYEPLDD